MANKKNNRTVQLLIRLTPKEYESIKKKAAKTGLSISSFVRQSVDNVNIMEAPPADFPQLISEIKRLGTTLNQLLFNLKFNGTVYPHELEECSQELFETVRMLYWAFKAPKGV